MGVRTKLLVNQSKFAFENNTILAAIKRDTTTGIDTQNITSDSTARSLQEWATWLVSQYAVFQSINITANEFVEIVYTLEPNVLELQEVTFSALLGAKIGYTGTISIVTTPTKIYSFGNSWGTCRLLLQGAETVKTSGEVIYSRMMQPERVTGKQRSDSFESIDYVVNEYRKDFGLKRWDISCRWVSKNKEQWIKDFLDLATNGKVSDTVKLYGDDFWIADTESYFLLTEMYDGCSIDVGHSLLLKFNIGLREV